MKLLLLATALCTLMAAPAFAQTVVLVRHAEKVDQSADPALSDAGTARAEALASFLADKHPALVVSSSLQRTRLTAQPTADAHDLTVEAVSLDGGTQAHVAAVVARVRSVPADKTVLVVGHSNTIPLIARALGYAEATDMPECEYDRMTVIQLDGGSVSGRIQRYGAATTCE